LQEETKVFFMMIKLTGLTMWWCAM